MQNKHANKIFAVNKIGVQPYIRVVFIPWPLQGDKTQRQPPKKNNDDLSICHIGEQLCEILILLLNDFLTRFGQNLWQICKL